MPSTPALDFSPLPRGDAAPDGGSDRAHASHRRPVRRATRAGERPQRA